ncbi:alpha/beta-hydrolase [Dothidotthia symphoricarpi CBS 119687]|uniref:Alpha/beta-hydrolase n=1 Tax=Dothidotthia symphoricarpi CBS 119687 TaxID=1392245 RepID=A0A6A6ALN5_9PLEO|nr:alpha/beta-hydrolase [Dothidotthia symphoricarpi CBS 119687]KAF2132466.1 alpha/beta-hydrolase [Dothidotthia symphoricarpi CBS 119687]
MNKSFSHSCRLDYIQLSDGRYLSYAIYGDLQGHPVLHCHGFPGSRLEGALWHDAALKYHIRLIVLDRPGFGFSSFQPQRSITDWPRDVAALLHHLELDEFYLLGTSGGGAYVLACLHQLPEGRVRGATIVSGIYPFELGIEDMPLMPRIMVFLAVWLTPLMAALIYLVLGRAARAKDPGAFNKAFMRDVKMRPEIDHACLEDESYKKKFLSSVREGIRANSYAFAWEARLLGGDWGFPLDEIHATRLTLWHGNMDIGNPVSMTRRAVTLLRGVRLFVLDEGHLSLPARHMEEILQELVST